MRNREPGLYERDQSDVVESDISRFAETSNTEGVTKLQSDMFRPVTEFGMLPAPEPSQNAVSEGAFTVAHCHRVDGELFRTPASRNRMEPHHSGAVECAFVNRDARDIAPVALRTVQRDCIIARSEVAASDCYSFAGPLKCSPSVFGPVLLITIRKPSHCRHLKAGCCRTGSSRPPHSQ